MALDLIPSSVQSDGNLTITYVPGGSNPLSAAILNAGTANDMTYSFTNDGWAWATTQDTVDDKRLALVQDLTRPGKVHETLELKYVASTTALSAQVVLVAGLTGFFVVRRGVANGTAYAAAQIVDVISFVLGVQRPEAPAENGLDVVDQTAYITSATQRSAIVVT